MDPTDPRDPADGRRQRLHGPSRAAVPGGATRRPLARLRREDDLLADRRRLPAREGRRRRDAGGLLLRRQPLLHVRARRHAHRRADPLRAGAPDGRPDPARAADRPGRRRRRHAGARRTPTTRSRSTTSRLARRARPDPERRDRADPDRLREALARRRDATSAPPSAGEAAVAKLHFPGLHPDAAAWLIANRSIAAVGIDTASIDYGQSTLFETHRALFADATSRPSRTSPTSIGCPRAAPTSSRCR